jgi:hypothetical protein
MFLKYLMIVDIFFQSFFDCYTMDTIFNTAFGLDINCQNDSSSKNIFFLKAKQAIELTDGFNLVVPFLSSLKLNIDTKLIE